MKYTKITDNPDWGLPPRTCPAEGVSKYRLRNTGYEPGGRMFQDGLERDFIGIEDVVNIHRRVSVVLPFYRHFSLTSIATIEIDTPF